MTCVLCAADAPRDHNHTCSARKTSEKSSRRRRLHVFQNFFCFFGRRSKVSDRAMWRATLLGTAIIARAGALTLNPLNFCNFAFYQEINCACASNAEEADVAHSVDALHRTAAAGARKCSAWDQQTPTIDTHHMSATRPTQMTPYTAQEACSATASSYVLTSSPSVRLHGTHTVALHLAPSHRRRSLASALTQARPRQRKCACLRDHAYARVRVACSQRTLARAAAARTATRAISRSLSLAAVTTTSPTMVQGPGSSQHSTRMASSVVTRTYSMAPGCGT